MPKIRHIIKITMDEHGFDFDVSVTPMPPGERLNRSFSYYETAHKYAHDLSTQNGWLVVDSVEASHAA